MDGGACADKTALGNLVGSSGLVSGDEDARSYFRAGGEGRFTVLKPRTTEEVRLALKYARNTRTPVYTVKDDFLPDWCAGESGIILDTTFMKEFERVDTRALAAHVQPGVTYEQLGRELERWGLKALAPGAATSPYVVRNAVNRVVAIAACRYPETQFSNLALVLADGTLHKTGQHALSEEYGDWKDIGGPHLDKWFHASEEIFGVVVRATIWVYPAMDGRKAQMFSFGGLEDMLGFLKEVSRKELCQEAVGLDGAAVPRLLGDGMPQVRDWAAVVGTETFEKLSSYQWRRIVEIAGKYGGADAGADGDALIRALERPWIVDPRTHLGFYALFSRAPGLDRLVMEWPDVAEGGNPVNRYFISTGIGRCLYAGYDLPSEILEGRADLAVKAVESGAFPDRPLGELASRLYPRTTGYLEQMRRVKRMLDPWGMLNPHQPYRGWMD